MMNPAQMIGQFRNFMNNPMQFLMQSKLNIPQQFANDPNGAIQYLLNNGTMTQEQYNQLQGMAKQMQSDPQFSAMFGNH